MIYEFECKKCRKHFEVVQSMNMTHVAYCCGVEASRVWTVFHTNRDLMYQFETPVFGSQPTLIHSKRQYKKLLKQNGLVDVTRNELRTIKPKDNAEKPRKELVKRISTKLKSENLNQAFPKYIKDFYGERKK